MQRPALEPRKRYVLDARTLTPHFRGIGRYVAGLLPAMAAQIREDEALTVITNPRFPGAIVASDVVQTVSVGASPFAVRQQWAVRSALRQAGGTVYHSPYYLMPYAPGVPTVLTAHDVIPLQFPDHSSLGARVLFRTAFGRALRTARAIITLSHSTRADIASHFPDRTGRIVVIAPGIASAFSPAAAGAVPCVRRKHGLPDAYVLQVAADRPHKNTARLIEAWLTLGDPAPALVLAGGAKRAREGRITWLGPVDEPDMPALYAGAAALVLPSLQEGFGFPVLEALACGTPVVCSDVPALRELAGTAAVYAEATDAGAIARAIETVLHDPVLRRRLAATGIERARAFSWPRAAAETLNLYRELGQP